MTNYCYLPNLSATLMYLLFPSAGTGTGHQFAPAAIRA
jgi:hypothetical protein